uniref:TBC1 domain family member 2B-like n=1 Tax=Phallusia mammillata TaxID=59560 RepID=A0A6F9DUY1_9ASCI|nr:TBC1 domain family member 2B-like [Phallusia mammillata]
MRGWMSYRQKGGIVGRLAGLRDPKLFFILTDECLIFGFKDETHIDYDHPEVSFNVQHSAVIFSQDSTKQFELIGEKSRDHVTFTLDKSAEVALWVSSIQAQRTMFQGQEEKLIAGKKATKQHVNERKRLPPPNLSEGGAATNQKNGSISNHENSHTASEDNAVFDDPLRSSKFSLSSSTFDDYEWDGDTLSPSAVNIEETNKLTMLTKELNETKKDLAKCRDRITSYQEVLASRDRQLFEMQDQLDPGESLSLEQTEAYKSIEEQLKSYRDQNALLNEEVLKLHDMFNKSQKNTQQQQNKAKKLAIELQHYKRDYLGALASCVQRPLVEPDDDARLVISEREKHIANLKSLAREVKMSNDKVLGCSVPSLGKHEHIDAFGFIRSLPNEPIQFQYLSLHLRDSIDALTENNEDNPQNLNKWRNFIRDNSEHFDVTNQLRKLILNGIPGQYRAYIWQKMIHYYVADIKIAAGEGYFEDLLLHQDHMKEDKEFAKTLKQIAMDVPRTMPANRDFMLEGSPLQERLSRVLIAFCMHCTKIGYCQGFNFLAGGCLLFLEEEDAFWFLVAVTEHLFPPHYYHNGLSGLLADQYMLQEILQQVLPRFSQHLQRFPEVDLAAVTTGWFLGLYFDCLPFRTVIRVWDCFLAHGHEAMFRVACGIIKQFEHELLEINDPSQLLHAIKNIPKLCYHRKQLIKDSFNLSNFPFFDDIEEQRGYIEADLIDKHEEKMKQRREFDERMILFEQFDEGKGDDLSWSFDCGLNLNDVNGGHVLLSGNCSLAQNSQVFEADFEQSSLKKLALPITSRVMCVHLITDDVIVVGLFSRKLQAYSLSESPVSWSMSLSDVVLCMTLIDDVLFVGTCDGKLHILQVEDAKRKPVHKDSIELSKRPTSSMCSIPEANLLWVASGPAIYVINTETYETDGFFLISTTMVQVSHMVRCYANEPDRRLVWVATRGSSVLQLRNASVYNGPPVLVYDIVKDTHLSPLYPMTPEEPGPANLQFERIFSMLVSSNGKLWVGTSKGNIKVYETVVKRVTKEGVDEESQEEESLENVLIFIKSPTSKPVRYIIQSRTNDENLLLTCAGGCDEPGALTWWTEDGIRKDFRYQDDPEPNMASRSISMPALQDPTTARMSDLLNKFSEDDAASSRSSESSSRSLDLKRGEMGGSGGTDAWKSAMKNAAATAMRTYRDKKPAMKKFMNVFGGNQS